MSHREIFDEIPAVVKKYPSNPWLQKLQLNWNGAGRPRRLVPADTRRFPVVKIYVGPVSNVLSLLPASF